jgi:hypothetical protein
LITEISVLEIGSGDLEHQLDDYLKRIKLYKKENQIANLKFLIKEAEKKQELETLNSLTVQLQNLLRVK